MRQGPFQSWPQALATGGLVVAHRGARSLAPENTLAAAQAAWQAGAAAWELDVTLSSDGHPLLLHDPDLRRTSNAAQVFPAKQSWLVAEFTLAQIRRLDFGSWFLEADPFGRLAAGEVSEQQAASYAHLKAPTLQEALEFTRQQGWLVNLEIKDLSGRRPAPDPVVAVASLVLELGLKDRVLVSSFNIDYLRQIKTLEPKIATGLLVRQRPADPAAAVAAVGALTFHPLQGLYQLQEIRALSRAGLAILPWCVNDRGLAQELWQAGARGVFSDLPQDLLALAS